MITQKQLGQKIKESREHSGWSQEELAKKGDYREWRFLNWRLARETLKLWSSQKLVKFLACQRTLYYETKSWIDQS